MRPDRACSAPDRRGPTRVLCFVRASRPNAMPGATRLGSSREHGQYRHVPDGRAVFSGVSVSAEGYLREFDDDVDGALALVIHDFVRANLAAPKCHWSPSTHEELRTW